MRPLRQFNIGGKPDWRRVDPPSARDATADPAARFPAVKSPESCNFPAIPSLNKALVTELAHCGDM